ncbi:putative membrane-bound lytic murein transglycosylase [Blattabacterium sp. (Mastotermes darwiniensis) str. MADAR]|jgi:membrane-bound lytic murein transglycosylase D|uniref:lytic transglycosylase domain-containing protein n=1 Tax=Blattabacterium sp. (Mastotermes darwiniensis) TaxID=39768 RepID=UPI000231DF50|nr:lytic transglycosylase domain-containing protein [Blattabacterium sp. (Mastotermes darwiniensis)]AER40360.1 putative membrane-bound lytic murein transglycosylase [Blattabacterium sp. (Mastotermes darwiniensis) str. MADAR]
MQSVSKPLGEQKSSMKNIPIRKLDLNHINIWKKIFGSKKKHLSVKRILSHKKNIIITNINPEKLRYRINHLNQESQIKILKYNTIIHASVEGYLRMDKYIGKILSLSNFYFPMFEEKLETHGIPKELKYIAIIESNLNPTITSKAGAQGIWQFMPKTGKIYDLQINKVYDERNDPVKSTEAACRYFKYLYKKIGNWELVLAAYNAGPKTIDKIIRRHNNKKDFWSLRSSFPKETKNYVPKFIAINYVMNYYKEHNIQPSHFRSIKYKDTVLIPIKGKISLKFFASSLKIPYKDLILLNPQYLVDVIIIPTGERYFLRLPKNKIFLFKEKEKNGYFLKKNE